MSEDTKEIKISKLSRRNFLGVGTTFLAAATGMSGLTLSAQSPWNAQNDECGHSGSNRELENNSLFNGDDKSDMPPVDCSDVISGLLC